MYCKWYKLLAFDISCKHCNTQLHGTFILPHSSFFNFNPPRLCFYVCAWLFRGSRLNSVFENLLVRSSVALLSYWICLRHVAHIQIICKRFEKYKICVWLSGAWIVLKESRKQWWGEMLEMCVGTFKDKTLADRLCVAWGSCLPNYQNSSAWAAGWCIKLMILIRLFLWGNNCWIHDSQFISTIGKTSWTLTAGQVRHCLPSPQPSGACAEKHPVDFGNVSQELLQLSFIKSQFCF